MGQLILSSKFCCKGAAFISYTSSSRKNFEPDATSSKLVGSQLRGGRYVRWAFVPWEAQRCGAVSVSLPAENRRVVRFLQSAVLCRWDSLQLVSPPQAHDPGED